MADSLARSAQLRVYQVKAPRAPLPSARGAALLLSSVAHGGTGAVAQAVLLRQLANTAAALYGAHKAAGEAQRAREILRVGKTELAMVQAALTPRPQPPVQTGEHPPIPVGLDPEAARLLAEADRSDRTQNAAAEPEQAATQDAGEDRYDTARRRQELAASLEGAASTEAIQARVRADASQGRKS